MADSASESDSGSVDGGGHFQPPSPVTRWDVHWAKLLMSFVERGEGGVNFFLTLSQWHSLSREQLQKRIESLQQQNRVLNVELETYKLRVKSLQVLHMFVEIPN